MPLNVGTVQSFATLNDKGFESGINNLKKKGERFSKDMQKNFDKIGRSLTSIGSKMTATISAPLIGAGALAVKTAADYETLRTSMDILNGSVEEGARNFERLKEFSAATPFQLGDLAKAQNMLQGFGMEADNAFKSIKMIGDIAAVSGGSIEGIGIAFGQAAAEGKLMTRDIRQLINQGVPAIKLLADTMGVAQSEVFSLAEQGEISFDILNKAFQEATSEGGMFADGMAKQAKTIGGVFSTLKDNVSLALGELGQTIVDELNLKEVIGNLISNIQTGVKWFQSLESSVKKALVTFSGIAIAIGPVIAGLGLLSTAIGAVSAPMLGLVAVSASAVAGITANWDNIVAYFRSGDGKKMWDNLKNTATTIFESLKSIVGDATDIIQGIWDEFGDSIVSTIQVSLEVIIKAFEITFGKIETMMSKLNGTMNTELNVMEDNWLTTLDKISGKIDQFMLNQGKKLLQTFGVLDTEYDRLRKEFEKRGLEFDVGFIVTEDDLEDMRTFLAKVEGMERKVEFRADLKAAKKDEFEKMMAGIRERDRTIPVTLSLPDMALGNKMFAGETPEVPIQIPEDSIISELDNLDKFINEFAENLKLGEKMALPMSQGLQALNILADQFTQSFGQGMANVVVQGQKLEETLRNIGKLLLSSAIQTGLSILLSGGLAGGGFFGKGGGLFGALFGGLFHGGGMVPGSGDKMIRAKGGEMVLTKSQQKAFSMGGGQSVSINSASIGVAVAKELDKRLAKLGPREAYVLAQEGRFM